MDTVFLPWYVHTFKDGAEDELPIGVYRSDEDARPAINRLREKPGFAAVPTAFEICPYKLNEDHWTEGFVLTDD